VKVYLSGRITGDPNYRMKFHGAALPLLALGHEVLNPAEQEGMSDGEAMRGAVRMLLSADAVVMLPDWGYSRGAVLERELAKRIGIPIIYDNRRAAG